MLYSHVINAVLVLQQAVVVVNVVVVVRSMTRQNVPYLLFVKNDEEEPPHLPSGSEEITKIFNNFYCCYFLLFQN